jgi:hypothetical protein
MQTELLAIVVVKTLAELAGMFLLGRGVLYLLAGQKRDTNMFYQILCIVTNPVMRLARLLTPKVIIDRHVPYVAFILVLWIWIGTVFIWLPDACGTRVDCSEMIERKRGS